MHIEISDEAIKAALLDGFESRLRAALRPEVERQLRQWLKRHAAGLVAELTSEAAMASVKEAIRAEIRPIARREMKRNLKGVKNVKAH